MCNIYTVMHQHVIGCVVKHFAACLHAPKPSPPKRLILDETQEVHEVTSLLGYCYYNYASTLYTMFLKLIKNYAGEGCGQGTLNNLQTALEDQVPNITYDCFDVFGDPTNSAEVQGLTNCTADIITSIQNGTQFTKCVQDCSS